VLSLVYAYFQGTKDSHYIWLMMLNLRQTKVVGQEPKVGKETGVGWEFDVRVAGVAGWERGIQEWMLFGKAVASDLVVLLFQSVFNIGVSCSTIFPVLGVPGCWVCWVVWPWCCLSNRSSIAAAIQSMVWKPERTYCRSSGLIFHC